MQIMLDDELRAELNRRERASITSKRDSLRAAMVLRKAAGVRQEDIAAELNVSRVAITKWTNRFVEHGLAGLSDPAGRGRKPSLPLEAKFWDVIGLYLDPPEHALVLCCDEKSQCQALERSQPGLPVGIGHIRTQTHNYIRHGTITLFAALNYSDGKIISRTEEQHTHVHWLRFLKQIDREVPAGLELHVIADNYGTHKHERVRAWLAKHPRFHMHFTPTGSSWLNLVERFSAICRKTPFGTVVSPTFVNSWRLSKLTWQNAISRRGLTGGTRMVTPSLRRSVAPRRRPREVRYVSAFMGQHTSRQWGGRAA